MNYNILKFEESTDNSLMNESKVKIKEEIKGNMLMHRDNSTHAQRRHCRKTARHPPKKRRQSAEAKPRRDEGNSRD